MKLMRTVAVLSFAIAMALGTTSCNDAVAPTMLANMGGMDGAAKFMTNWTSAMSANEALSKSLTADDMSMVARGFTNEIATASKIPIPNAGVDLVQVLKDKNLSKENVTAMGDALKAAAGTSQLSPEATKGAMSLWDGVVKRTK